MYGLILDVDGVIADSEAVNARASIKMFHELFGLQGVKHEDFAAGLGRGAEAYVRAAARVHGLQMNDAQVARATQRRQQNFLDILRHEHLPAFPGVLELINAALSDRKWKVAIATSSTRQKSTAVLTAAKVPIAKLMYVCGDDVTRKKPDPELFLVATRKLGLAPAQCVVVEDAPNGVAAAHNAGCKCVAVTNSTAAEKLRAADLIVDRLTNVTLAQLVALTAA